jgi:hypothetical protein
MYYSTYGLMVIQIFYNFIIVNFHAICNGSKLTVFDGLLNDNEIEWNLNEHQSIGRGTHL